MCPGVYLAEFEQGIATVPCSLGENIVTSTLNLLLLQSQGWLCSAKVGGFKNCGCGPQNVLWKIFTHHVQLCLCPDSLSLGSSEDVQDGCESCVSRARSDPWKFLS